MEKQEFNNRKKIRKLLDQVRDVMRLRHYAFRTERTYVSWIKRFILFHDKKHLKDMGEAEVEISSPALPFKQGERFALRNRDGQIFSFSRSIPSHIQ